jgi:cardiolipin synthase
MRKKIMSLSRGKKRLMSASINSAVSKSISRLADEARWLTMSNVLTCLRIVLAPFVALAIYSELWKLAFIIFLLAAGTDLLDGYLARLFNEHTRLGRILDPIADKFFLVISLGSLVFVDSPFIKVPIWFFILILVRESILLTGGYLVMCITGGSESIKPSIWGKLTTFMLIFFIAVGFWNHLIIQEQGSIIDFLLVIISMLSLFSLFNYIKVVYGELKRVKK